MLMPSHCIRKSIYISSDGKKQTGESLKGEVSPSKKLNFWKVNEFGKVMRLKNIPSTTAETCGEFLRGKSEENTFSVILRTYNAQKINKTQRKFTKSHIFCNWILFHDYSVVFGIGVENFAHFKMPWKMLKMSVHKMEEVRLRLAIACKFDSML